MTISRRLLNLAGTLVVLVAFIAGTLLMALPVYLESVDVNSQEAQVAASNQVLATQIDGLRAKQAEMPAIQEELDGLHAQLPGIPQLDDVSRLAVKAADKSGSAITSVEFGDLGTFTHRSMDTVLAGLPKTATDLPGDTDESDMPTSGDATADGASTRDTSGNGGGAQGDGDGDGDGNDLQIAVTITVDSPDLPSANGFLDELRSGPRLLQINTVAGNTDEETGDVTLTVTGSVFFRLK